MLAERLLEKFPVDCQVLGTRINEIAVAGEVAYGNLAREYLGLSVKISKDLKLPYHEEMAERRECLGGCCYYRIQVDRAIDAYGGKDKEHLMQNNFRITDVSFLTATQSGIESIHKRIQDGLTSRDEVSFLEERLYQFEEYQHLGLLQAYTYYGVKPKESITTLYHQFFNGIASEAVRKNVEIWKLLDRRKLFYDKSISDISITLGNLSMQVREAR